MPRIPGTTSDSQSQFLSAFRFNPSGPPPDDWPSASILRRWLRRPRFRAALNSLRRTFRCAIDFHLLSAATHAARSLSSAVSPDAPADLPEPRRRISTDILKLTNSRQPRVHPRKPRPKDRDDDREETFDEAAVRLAHPSTPRHEAIAFFHELTARRHLDLAKQTREQAAAQRPEP